MTTSAEIRQFIRKTSVMTQLGSLNAIEQRGSEKRLRQFIGGSLPSADSLGRIANQMIPGTVRTVNREIYRRLKRNKALEAPWHGLMALVIDGTESHSSYLQKCDGCLERKVKCGDEERTQYYHRHVRAMSASLLTISFIHSSGAI